MHTPHKIEYQKNKQKNGRPFATGRPQVYAKKSKEESKQSRPATPIRHKKHTLLCSTA
jgi:hypothetical protein